MRPRSIHASKGKAAAPAASPSPGVRRAQPSELTARAASASSADGIDPRLLPFVHRLAELIVADLLRSNGKPR